MVSEPQNFEGVKTGHFHLCNAFYLLIRYPTFACGLVVKGVMVLAAAPLGSHTSELHSISLTPAVLLSADIPTPHAR